MSLKFTLLDANGGLHVVIVRRGEQWTPDATYRIINVEPVELKQT